MQLLTREVASAQRFPAQIRTPKSRKGKIGTQVTESRSNLLTNSYRGHQAEAPEPVTFKMRQTHWFVHAIQQSENRSVSHLFCHEACILVTILQRTIRIEINNAKYGWYGKYGFLF